VSLAAFFAQPSDEEEPAPEATLAEFFAQPSEDEEPAPGAAVVAAYDRARAERENALAELSDDEIVAHLGQRYGVTVAGLIVRNEGDEFDRIVWTAQ